MNETILECSEDVAQSGEAVEVVSADDTGDGENSGSTDISSDAVMGTNESVVVYQMEYDEELGGYPVVIVNDLSEVEASTFALPSGSGGYQVSDYWLNYFRGILQKNPFADYLAFATREYYNSGSSYNNYLTHYWLYVGDLENGGEVTVYDCYAVNSINYVDISTEVMGAVDVGSYDTLVYSNLGNVADIREGVGIYGTLAVLFSLGVFAVYALCRDLFRANLWRVYRRKCS